MSRDECERMALVELLGDVRSELSLAPDELTTRRHLVAMHNAAPGARRDRPVRRRHGVRAVAAGWVTAATLLGGAGLAAATGALPGPIQHAVADVAHTVGVSLPGAPDSRHHGGPGPSPSPARHPSTGARGEPGHDASPPGQGGPPPVTPGGGPGGSAATRPSDNAGGAAAGGGAAATAPPGAMPPSSSTGNPPTATRPQDEGTGQTTPGKRADAPGHGATPPGQGGTPPGRQNQNATGPSAPGNSADAPGQQKTTATTATTDAGHAHGTHGGGNG